MTTEAAHPSDPPFRAQPVTEQPAASPAPGQPRKPVSSVLPSARAALRGVPRHANRVPAGWHEQPQQDSGTMDRPRLRSVQAVEDGQRSASAISLLEVEPDLRRVLSSEQRVAAERFPLPLAVVERGGDLSVPIVEADAFGAVVLEGLLVQTVQIDRQETLTLVGPGALLPLTPSYDWLPLARSQVRAAEQTRLAVLGKEFMIAARRWPWLVICLHERMLEQSARVTKQLAISQLPRVEDRVVAMLKLLAESWGKVTPDGIRLPLPLTHETLGGLVGARRPSVSIALKALAERNAIIRRDKGWLITRQ